MPKLSRFTRLAISLPRLFVAVAIVALAAGGVHLTALAPSAKSTPSQSTSTKKPADPAVVAPTTTPSQSASVPKPLSVPATLQPATVVSIPHSTTPTPVVTAAPTASVSGLAPVNPTSSSSNSNSQGSSGSTPSSSSSPATTTGYTSTNWSGYMAATGYYTAIASSWTVPTATGVTGKTSADAAWIGIGGVSAGDLIQVGTDDTVSPSGQETSSAFYELLPQAATTITTLPVTAGDSMAASLTELTAGQWKITITNITTGGSYTTTLSYTSSNSSAEWIEEDPSTTFNRLVPLDGFTSVAFTGGVTTNNGASVTIANANAQPITLVSSSPTHEPIATPSALGRAGQDFTVTQDTAP